MLQYRGQLWAVVRAHVSPSPTVVVPSPPSRAPFQRGFPAPVIEQVHPTPLPGSRGAARFLPTASRGFKLTHLGERLYAFKEYVPCEGSPLRAFVCVHTMCTACESPPGGPLTGRTCVCSVGVRAGRWAVNDTRDSVLALDGVVMPPLGGGSGQQRGGTVEEVEVSAMGGTGTGPHP